MFLSEGGAIRVALPVELTPAERATPSRWSRGRTAQARLAVRASIVPPAAEGQRDRDIAATLGANRHTVALWRKDFRYRGIQ